MRPKDASYSNVWSARRQPASCRWPRGSRNLKVVQTSRTNAMRPGTVPGAGNAANVRRPASGNSRAADQICAFMTPL